MTTGWVRLVAMLDPTPTAWDRVFGSRDSMLVRALMRDGTFIGGLYAEASFASSYPEAQDVYLEQAWWLSDSGRFERPVAGSRGVLISRSEAVYLEFLSATIVGGGR